jgi:methenyltetrahydromethanopterin cyclohydrolase
MKPLDAVADLSRAAVRLADLMEERAPAIGVSVTRLPGGTRIIDAGIDAPGSFAAGCLYAEATMGGLGRVAIAPRSLGPAVVPEARVTVDLPLVACLGSQYAGWKVAAGRFFAMGSGPARAIAAAEPLFDRFALRARPEPTVLLLESERLPGPEVADLVARRCGVAPADLTLVAAPTGSLAGCTQVAARSVETALHKLLEIGFDVGCVVAGSGSCPIAPGIPDTLRAIGRTNDAVLYGADVSLWVMAEDAAIESVLERVPSCASREHGRLFFDVFREHGDFYKIDPLLFSPARVTFVNAATGRVFSAGRLDEPTLQRSFGLAAKE